MNDYMLPRFSKNDLREFWSTLLEKKKELTHRLAEANEMEVRSIEASLAILAEIMGDLEKSFDLF